MKIPFVCFLAIICFTTSANALPLFARKYNTSCFTCHVHPPLLNDFGERFRASGFEIPGARPKYAAREDQGLFPVAFLMQPAVAHVRERDNIYSTLKKEVSLTGLGFDLLSTASLGGRFSYFSEVEVEFNEDETEIALGMLYAMYNDVFNNGSGNLNLRAGKLHFIPSLTHTSYLANTDPLIYGDHPFLDSVTTKNDLHFAHATLGTSAFGIFPEIADGLSWELGYTIGTRRIDDIRYARAIFGSFNQAVGIGKLYLEAGAFFFGGRQNIVGIGNLQYPKINNHYRTGFSLKFLDPWIQRFSVYGQYVTGEDDNIDYWGRLRKVSGSFVGVNAIIFPEKLYAFTRYDELTSDDGAERSTWQIDCGLRYHLLPNVILTAGATQVHSQSGISGASHGHSHSIVPAVPLSGSHSTSTASSSLGKVDLTTTSINLGILLAY